MTINTSGPFPNEDTFTYALSNSWLDFSDVCRCACVCKVWNAFTEIPAYWQGLFISKGIPMVSSEAGARDYRSDFRLLYPVTTVSGEAIRRTLGEPIGRVPCVTVEFFDRLSQPDLFDPTKFQKETFELVVEYQFIERVLGTNECPLALDECGNLEEMTPSEGAEVDGVKQTPTLIHFTLENRITLAKYPLMGKEHMPVFGYVNDAVLLQCDYCPLKVNVYYQTRRIVEGTRSLSYSEQKAFVGERGSAVMPLGPRVLSNEVQILSSGTCPDVTDSYARTSCPVRYGANVCQSDVGGFAPRGGVHVHTPPTTATPHIGVVAGGSAEVPAALGSW